MSRILGISIGLLHHKGRVDFSRNKRVLLFQDMRIFGLTLGSTFDRSHGVFVPAAVVHKISQIQQAPHVRRGNVDRLFQLGLSAGDVAMTAIAQGLKPWDDYER